MSKLILFTLCIFVGCSAKTSINYNGLPITIEYKKGTVRSGVDREGNDWQQKMFHHYGHFDDIVGADGEKLDVYVNAGVRSNKLFRITQLNVLTKEFDEYKIMVAFKDEEHAKRGYLIHYPDNWEGYGGIEEISFMELVNEW